MVDSVSVAVGGEVAAWVTGLLVVGESGCEGEHSDRDADADAGDCASAVRFEGELAFAGPDDAFDPLPDWSQRAVAAGFVFAVGAQEAAAEVGHEFFKLLAGEAFVGEHGVAVELDTPHQLTSDLALGNIGWGELERDRHPVRGAQQIQPVAPEVARVALAPAIGRGAGQLRAPRGLARLGARNG